MKLQRSLRFVIALTVLLLTTQQVGYWHALGHLGFASGETVVQQQDLDHGDSGQLTHICSTCVAFAGLDATPTVTFAGPALAALAMLVLAGVLVGLLHATPQWRALPRGPPTVF